MAEYQLYCFAQSGNAYRVALMLNLIGADWEPIFVDFFAKGEPRTPEYRSEVNEMGEVPVLVHGAKKLTQSGVILTYLAKRSGKFRPEGEDEELEALRWIIFDNQKVNGFLGPYRFLRTLAKPPGDPAVLAFLKGRIDNNLAIVDKRLSTQPFVLGARPTIADLSLVRLPLLSGRRVRLRHPRAAQEHRGLARPHQGAARLEAPLRPDARPPAAGTVKQRTQVGAHDWSTAQRLLALDTIACAVHLWPHEFGSSTASRPTAFTACPPSWARTSLRRPLASCRAHPLPGGILGDR